MADQPGHETRARAAAIEFLVPGGIVLVRVEGRPFLNPERIHLGCSF
jgi:hypothetical protein